MFFPIYDKNPLKIIPFQAVTVGLIVINVLAYLYQSNLTEVAESSVLLAYGMIPQVLFDQAELGAGLARIPAELTLFTSLFLHSDWLHLLGNMMFLWVFGDNVEDSMGHVKFVVFYLICGLAAGLAHALFNPASDLPLIGASGAIGGILGAYILLHPRVKVMVFLLRFPLYLPAYIVLCGWLAIQFYLVLTDSAGNMAVWAHLGGFVAGAALIPFFKYPHIPPFDRGTEH